MINPKIITNYVNYIRNSRLLRLTMSVTYICNLKCKHCNIWKTYIEEPELINRELKPKEIERTVINTAPFQAAFTGGEPLIKLGISKTIRNIIKYPGPPFIVSINSNGFATNTIAREVERFARLAERTSKRVAVSISIDGPEEVHDNVRGVKGSFRRAVETLGRLMILNDRYNSLNVFIEYTVMELNLGKFSDMLDQVESIISRRITGDMIVVNVVQASDYYKVKAKPDYSKIIKEIINIERELRKRYSLGKRLSPHGIVQNAFIKRLEKWLEGKYVHNCFAAEKTALVDPYGDIYPCLPRYGEYKLGNVRDYQYNVRKALASKAAAHFRKEVRPFCNCWTPCESYTTLLARPWSLLR